MRGQVLVQIGDVDVFWLVGRYSGSVEEDILDKMILECIRNKVDWSSDIGRKPIENDQTSDISYRRLIEQILSSLEGLKVSLHYFQTIVDPNLEHNPSYQNLQRMEQRLREIILEIGNIDTKEKIEIFLGLIDIQGNNDFKIIASSASRL
jgi:hypothetical protein